MGGWPSGSIRLTSQNWTPNDKRAAWVECLGHVVSHIAYYCPPSSANGFRYYLTNILEWQQYIEVYYGVDFVINCIQKLPDF